VPKPKCSYGGEPAAPKLASIYWAWYTVSGQRVSWKTFSCVGCAPTSLGIIFRSLRNASESPDEKHCASCGQVLDTDIDPIYVTLYLPGQERTDPEVWLDSACAAIIRSQIQSVGQRLPDRNVESRGPLTLATDPWEAIGFSLVDREN